jgi:small subunit ribosomal protein S26e
MQKYNEAKVLKFMPVKCRTQGAYIASPIVLKHYCISCAVHFKIIKVRSEESRRRRNKLRG